MAVTSIDRKINDTLRHIKQYGLHHPTTIIKIEELYYHTLTNLSELKNLALYQIAGTLFSVLAFEKYTHMTKFPNLAYYCLTQGTSVIQPSADMSIALKNIFYSKVERAKLLLSGGAKLVSDRLYIFDDLKVSEQAAFDITILGDIIQLKNESYQSSEIWWQRALEDEPKIRFMYRQYSELEIIGLSENVHKGVANCVYNDLYTYAQDFGFV